MRKLNKTYSYVDYIVVFEGVRLAFDTLEIETLAIDQSAVGTVDIFDEGLADEKRQAKKRVQYAHLPVLLPRLLEFGNRTGRIICFVPLSG